MSSNLARLSDPLSNELKEEIISRFWRKGKAGARIEDYALYFQFYRKHCEALYLGIFSEAKALSADTHEHILAIVDTLSSHMESNEDCTRYSLRQQLHEKFPSLVGTSDGAEDNYKLNNSISLALRLWLTIDIRESRFAPATSAVQWSDNITLKEFIKQQFPGPRPVRALDEKSEIMILDSDFTVVNLQRIGGIIIDWTCNLNEHLKFDRESRKLKVYTLKTCLYDHRARKTSVIPGAIIDETILTLQLLFPDWDPETSKLLQKIDQPILVEDRAQPDRLFLSDFHIWRDRLSIVCFEYQSPPSAWRQIWTDRRNRLQWYTFWIAIAIFILTIIFGLITSITACLQTKYAYEALQLAKGAAQYPSMP